MKVFKKKVNTPEPQLPELDDEEKIDYNGIDVVVDRVLGGLVGTLRIESEINKPLFKPGDFAYIIAPTKLLAKDFILYFEKVTTEPESEDSKEKKEVKKEYFLRRIIKFKGTDIYVAGDNEKEYHVVKRDDVVGKAVTRQRGKKTLSLALAPKKKLYTFKKVTLANFRLGNRVLNYAQEQDQMALELAAQQAALAAQSQKNVFENAQTIKYDIDLDSELKDFLSPDQLVKELREALAGNTTEVYEEEEEVEYIEADEDEIPEDAEVIYTDEDGNIIEAPTGDDVEVVYEEVSEEVTEEAVEEAALEEASVEEETTE